MFTGGAPVGPFSSQPSGGNDEQSTPEVLHAKDDTENGAAAPPILLPTPTATDPSSSTEGNSPGAATTFVGTEMPPPQRCTSTTAVASSRASTYKRRGGAVQAGSYQPRRLSVGLLRPLLSATTNDDFKGRGTTKGDMGLGRGRVKLINVDDLEVKEGQGGQTVMRSDRKLGDASYLTETLTTKERKSVVLPNSRAKNVWDALIAVLVSWTAIMLPIQLCYDDVPQSLPPNLIAFDVFTDVIFILDIILNFHVGYIDEAIIIVDKTKIRRKYLARWFGIDAVGSFPGDTIFLCIAAATQDAGEEGGFGNTEAGLLTLFKILKIPKLMRLGRLFKTLEKLEGAANIANIIILLLVMVTVNHWISCLWFLMTKSSGGWVESRGLSNQVWTKQYPETFYTTLMMVMGDSVEPANGGEYLLSSVIVVIGITMNATVFASIASYAAQISSDTAQHKNKMNQIQRSIKSLQLPDGLAHRIQQYYEYCWTRHRDFAAQGLLDSLPTVFKRRCAMAAHEDKLRSFVPFQQADERFIASLTTKLRPEVYMPEAFILVAGQVYTCAYFMQRGLCQVTWPSDQRDMVNVLTVDDYFGELSLFVTKKLSYTVRACTHVDCFRLDRTDFIEVMRSHPAGAVHVADHMESLLPSTLAKRVTREIYDYSGLRELLAVFMPDGKWRPPKGLADRIRRFAVEHEDQLDRLRKRASREKGAGRPKTPLDAIRRYSSVRHRTSVDNSMGSTPSAGNSALQRDVHDLAIAHDELNKRVVSGQRRLEAKLDELMALLNPKAPQTQTNV